MSPQPCAVCQICMFPLLDTEESATCPGCQSRYHRGCWDELGGCATYGCSHMVEIKKAEEAVTYWGDTEKKCPICAETIPIETLECPICKTSFDDIKPRSREEVLKPEADKSVDEYRRPAIWLLVLSAIGCTSPLILLIGGAWYLKNKTEMSRVNSPARALTLIALAISGLYIVVLLIGYGVFKLMSPA
jgi:hypothetical protein